MKVINKNIIVSILVLVPFLSLILPSGAVSQIDINMKIIQEALLNRISVDFKDVPLGEALSIIAIKGEFHLNYNESIIPGERKISLKMNNVPAFKVLIKVLDGTGTGLTVTSGGDLVIVPSTKAKGNIKGVVIDKKSREPLVGANIMIIETQMGAANGKDGRFNISHLPTGIYTLEASMIGYERKRVEN